jgi:hypothetical protein
LPICFTGVLEQPPRGSLYARVSPSVAACVLLFGALPGARRSRTWSVRRRRRRCARPRSIGRTRSTTISY